MRKFFLISALFLITGMLMGQSTNKIRQDLQIYKTAPAILLNGSGALINFNDGDLILTQSTNTLTLSGGNLALGTNSLTMTGSIGATGARVTKGWFTNLEITNLPTVGGANLSALYTSGDIAIGANNLTMTGSIAATGARVTKGWFTNLEITNSPTVNGTAISAIYAPIASPTFTGSINTTGARVTKAWLTDLEVTNLPTISGVAINTTPSFTTSITVLPGDTTVAAAYGKIVFKTSDSTLYVCKYIKPTGKKKWYKLDN
jgi:hypothetical protein